MKANLSRFIVSFVIFCFFGTTAQNFETCASAIPPEQWEKELGRLIGEKKRQAENAKPGTVYTIPVIIHIIHGGEPVGTYPNISQAQIASQIRVLNEEFAGLGKNSGNYPAQAFNNYAVAKNIPSANLDAWGRIKIADCQIEFCLAKYDTLGNPLAEPGIDRVDYHSYNWVDPASISAATPWMNNIKAVIKPATVWNVSKYLNIWLTDKHNSISTSGFSTFPPFAGLAGVGLYAIGTHVDDGVWMYTKCFGASQYYPSGTYSSFSAILGKIAVHEIGHYFGLRHIWGDGSCVTDYCDDTPSATAANFGSPTYPAKVNLCPNNPDGEMFMNYMDYSSEQTVYMFTPDQAFRMMTAITNSPYRQLLGTHGLCSVEPLASVASFSLPNTLCGNSAVITPTNSSTGTPPPTYTWSVSGGGIISPNANSQFVSISFPAGGNYSISLTTDNGTVSSTTKVFTVTPLPVVTISGAPTVACVGELVTLTASGANSYYWKPMTLLANIYSYVANGNLTFTVTGTGAGNCKSSTVMTISSQICTGTTQENLSRTDFRVYPNPVSGVLTMHCGFSEIRMMSITDVSGRVLHSVNDLGAKEVSVNMDQWEKGVYFVITQMENGHTFSERVIKE